MKPAARIVELVKPEGGVKPAFTPYHVLMALHYLNVEGPLGRITLSKLLKLGEASTKTLLKRLEKEGLIHRDPVAGAYLSSEGISLIRELEKSLKVLGRVELESPVCEECPSSAILLRGYAEKLEVLKNVLNLRDHVIRYGARGALILTVEGGILKLPTPTGMEPGENIIKGGIPDSSELSDGDVIMVAICELPEAKCTENLVNAALDILSKTGC